MDNYFDEVLWWFNFNALLKNNNDLSIDEITKTIMRDKELVIENFETLKSTLKEMIEMGLVLKNKNNYKLTNGMLSYLKSSQYKKVTDQIMKLRENLKNKDLTKEEYESKRKKLLNKDKEKMKMYL